MRLLRSSSEGIPEPPREPTPDGFEIAKRYRLGVIAVQRAALLDPRDHGTFDADLLANALAGLDATQIDIEMRGTLAG